MIDALQLAILVVVASVICREDFRSLRIPDWTNGLLLVSGLLFRSEGRWTGLFVPLASACLMLVVVFALRETMSRVKGRQALGLGDVKLMAASVVWIDATDIPAFLLVACSLALAFVAVTAAQVGGSVTNRRIPFGPFLCFSLIAVWSIEHLSPRLLA